MSVSANQSSLAPHVDPFVAALKNYDGSLVHLKPLLQAVRGLGDDLNNGDLKRYALQLGKIDGGLKSRAGISRFSREAPKQIHPKREEVVGNVLAMLDASTNPKVKALGRELASRLFREIAKDVEIYGRTA